MVEFGERGDWGGERGGVPRGGASVCTSDTIWGRLSNIEYRARGGGLRAWHAGR
jgi:hypothetical protein